MTRGVYSLGIWILQKIGSFWRVWLSPLLALGTIAASVVAARAFASEAWGWGSVFAALILLMAGGNEYLKLSENHLKAESERATSERQSQFGLNLAGPILYLIELVRDADRSDRSEWNQRLTQIQTEFLKLMCERLARDTRTGHELFSSNWTVEENSGTERLFRTRMYDAMRKDRVAGRSSHPVKADFPGAAQAFLTGKTTFVPDTQDPQLAKFFTGSEKYRTILSIPVVVGEGKVLGVTNIDCTKPGILKTEHEGVVADLAMLVGLAEEMKE